MTGWDLLGMAVIWSLGVWTGWFIRDIFRGGTLTIKIGERIIYERQLK